ncbi:MAG: hypothetical protein CL927_05205 [Deltaproteobacteria bacterium]|nr:hypothetical protein [Deltaproteobacteria bacterium]HCH64590.1 hypothetical protein [Deltaproteobacteria bacterium]
MLAMACGAGAPTTIGECAGIRVAAERETCRYEMLQPAVADSRVDDQVLDAGLAEIKDVTSRDLVLLRLAITAPKHAAALCGRVRTAGADEKCRQVLGRPHLGTERRAPKPPPDGTAQ